jgi:hypothetical protein
VQKREDEEVKIEGFTSRNDQAFLTLSPPVSGEVARNESR